MSDLQQIKALLQASIHALVQELAPDGTRKGSYWIARNPTRADDHAGSFWVRIAGSGVGVWADEATGDGAARSPNKQWPADVLGLVQYCNHLPDVKAALDWSRDFLKLGSMPAADRERRAKLIRDKRDQVEKHDAERLEKARKSAFAIYVEALKRPFLGSPADIYLRSRGIDVRGLGRKPGVLGWLPPESYGALHAETKTRWPVMVAGMQDDSGRTLAIHRTFLAHDGAGKAPVEPARKIYPSPKGLQIRLWRGSSRMSVQEAASHGLRETLVLCEGIEDGLSLALACPDLRIWCCGTVGGLCDWRLPECVDQVIVVKDNDWGNPQAAATLQRGLEQMAAQGRTVKVASSHVGKDANDALRSGDPARGAAASAHK